MLTSSSVRQAHSGAQETHKRSRYNPTYSQTESKYTDAVIGSTRNHRIDAVEARKDKRSRILLTCPACRRDEILERSLSLLPAASLKPAVLASKSVKSYGQVSRKNKQRTGFTKRSESGRISSIAFRRSRISWSPGTRGEWISYTPGPMLFEYP